MRGRLIGLALAAVSIVTTASAQSFLGFRLLDLNGSHVRWASDGTEKVTVTYAFVVSPVYFADASNCEALAPVDGLLRKSGIRRPDFRKEARAAFDMWEFVANIEFQEISDQTSAQILIGAQQNPEGRAFADVRYRPGNERFREIERSLICLNPTKPWKIGFDGNLQIYDLRYTIAHEIGHAIGLDHPEPNGQLMSHRYQERFRTLQTGDVDGAIQIYGANRRPAKP